MVSYDVLHHREYHSPKEALHRFVTRLDRPCAACTWRSSPASTCNMARGEFDRSSWSSTSMITDRSPDDVFQLRKSKTTTKRRLGITEAFVSETILFTCGNSACKRGVFAPPPWLCVSRSSQSRAEHRKSISLWTSATCLVPVPAATSRSVVFLSDVPSAPDHEAVLQVEEGVMSAVVEMRCGAACADKYRLYREGRPLDKEEDKEVSPSLKRELFLDKLNEPG